MTRTWPEDWDARKRGAGCSFCEKQPGEPLYVGTASNAYLERQAVASGHALVVFRDRHVADFTSLTPAEAAAYWGDVHSVARLIEQVFAPCHMNYLLLGNVMPHLHVHVVPRYLDDAAPGGALPWKLKPVEPVEFERQVRRLTEAARTLPK